MTTFNIIVGDTEYNKFVPSAYTGDVEQFVPLMFYPKADTFIIDKRKGLDKVDLYFLSRTTVNKLDEIAKLIDVSMKETNLALCDLKNMRMVLDIEHDVPYVWNTRPSKGTDEYLIFSGDGRNLVWTCYYQTKIAVWAMNIVSEFDMTMLTMQGKELIINWVETYIKEILPWVVKEAISKYCQTNSGTTTGEEHFNGYNFSRLVKLVEKVKPPTRGTNDPLLLPPPPPDYMDVIVAGEVPISYLVGQSEFDDYIGCEITFDLPIPMDIIDAEVDATGQVIFHKRIGGNTTLEQLSEDFAIPLDKCLFMFNSEGKG